ncbi:c-type cytochrome [Ancylobacter oerskovii]|uniref:C-type cytochrome n=2 Tax=Ancylobacter oerskovii TaxID=459519 RepID=A0ABW4Z2E9_9HYPH
MLPAFGHPGPAAAQDDPIADRQEVMAALSEAHKLASAMVKGHAPYDATAAAGAMRSIAADAATLAALFPPGSETGDDTRAAPAIWRNFEDFVSHIARLRAAAEVAATSASQGLAGFTPAYDAVANACKACHAAYRLPTGNAPAASSDMSHP